MSFTRKSIADHLDAYDIARKLRVPESLIYNGLNREMDAEYLRSISVNSVDRPEPVTTATPQSKPLIKAAGCR